MGERRTIIVLPSPGSADYDQTIDMMSREAHGHDEALLMPLGFHSESELSHFNATIRYPEEFFDRGRSDRIDSEALKLSRSWYRSLGNKTTFKGVDLAQMCEYSFYFVFVDCLRSIDITNGLLESEQVERLILPKGSLTNEISEICYESLPSALEIKAKVQGIEVEWVGKPTIKDTINANESQLPSKWDKPHLYERMLETFSPFVRSNAVLFQQVYAFDRLSVETRKHGLKPLRTIPYRRSNADTKAFSELMRSETETSIKKVLEEQSKADGHFSLATRLAQDRLREFFLHDAPMLAGYVEWATYYSRKMRPKVIACMEDITPVNRCISRVLRKGGAKVVVLQHGMLTKDMAGSYLMPIEGNIQAVWGQYFVDWHTKRGKDPADLTVTGSPIYENLSSHESDLNAVKRDIGLEPDRPVLLVGTSRFSGISSVFTIEKEKRFFDNVYGGLGSGIRYQVVTKMHPSCGKPYYDMATESAGRNSVRTILTKGNLRELLTLAIVVVMPSSTIGYEAVLLKKPLVCVDFEGCGEASAFADDGVAVSVKEKAELANGIEAAIALTATKEYERSRERFVEYHLDGNDPSRKVAGLIGRLFREREERNGG